MVQPSLRHREAKFFCARKSEIVEDQFPELAKAEGGLHGLDARAHVLPARFAEDPPAFKRDVIYLANLPNESLLSLRRLCATRLDEYDFSGPQKIVANRFRGFTGDLRILVTKDNVGD